MCSTAWVPPFTMTLTAGLWSRSLTVFTFGDLAPIVSTLIDARALTTVTTANVDEVSALSVMLGATVMFDKPTMTDMADSELAPNRSTVVAGIANDDLAESEAAPSRTTVAAAKTEPDAASEAEASVPADPSAVTDEAADRTATPPATRTADASTDAVDAAEKSELTTLPASA